MIKAARNLEIAVCCPPNTQLEAELRRRNVCTLPFFIGELHRKSRWHRLLAALGVTKACAAFRPDVIHLNQSGAFRTVLPAAFLMNLPIVCHVRIFEDVAYLARQAPSAHRLKSLIAISAAIEAEIRQFDELTAIPAHRIYDAYIPITAAGDVVQPPGRFACVGRITPIKGQEVLIRALALASYFERGAEGLIIGDGEPGYLQQLQEIVSTSGCVPVTWTGFVADVYALLRTCQVLVCPSHREPLGRVIFEAWDAGVVPLVYSGAGGAAEIIRESAGGLTYDTQTPECLATKLAEALRLSEAERLRLISNGRLWMLNHCAPEPFSRAIAAVLEDAAA
jgi:glycosyltransferase involved in cell wall biosynthesis